MVPSSNTDFNKLFSDFIKKQLVILGPDITFAKVRNVVGVKVDANGDVQEINGDPNIILEELINQFVDLSSQIVRKAMETVIADKPEKTVSVNDEIDHEIKIPSIVEPEPLHTINVESIAGESPNEEEDATVKEKPAPVILVPSPDQRVDPLKEDVKMPGGTKRSEHQVFTEDELDNLNKSLEDIDNKPSATDSYSSQ